MSTSQQPARIGIVARRWNGRSDARGAQREAMFAMPVELAYALAETGALPLLFEPSSKAAISAHVDAFDALVLQGGPNIDAALFGETRHADENEPDTERDTLDIALLEAFVARGKPVLGICRGCQLLNVAFGGTLYTDLPTQFGATQMHSDPERYVALEHEVILDADGYFFRLYERARGRVNSAHRQGIRRLASNLRAEARCASDGLIEAFRGRGEGYVVGVQWHPEFQSNRCDALLDRRALFVDFVSAAQQVRA
jgi:putative glutamine amidotransferase